MIINSDKILSPGVMSDHDVACNNGGKLRFVEFRLKVPEQTKDPQLLLIKLPVGNVRLLGGLSRISAKFKNEVKLDIGWLKYKIPLQNWIDTEPSGLDKNQKPGNFTIAKRCALQTAEFSTQDGLEIAVFVKGIAEEGDSVHGYIVYVKD